MANVESLVFTLFTESWHLPVFFSLFQILFHLHAMLMFTAKCTAASILVFARHIFLRPQQSPKTFCGGRPFGANHNFYRRSTMGTNHFWKRSRPRQSNTAAMIRVEWNWYTIHYYDNVVQTKKCPCKNHLSQSCLNFRLPRIQWVAWPIPVQHQIAAGMTSLMVAIACASRWRKCASNRCRQGQPEQW